MLERKKTCEGCPSMHRSGYFEITREIFECLWMRIHMTMLVPIQRYT
jgi:hypothetical protein